MLQRQNIWFVTFISISLLFSSLYSKAQEFENTFGVVILKDTLEAKTGLFAFNTFTLTNYSTGPIQIKAKLNLPQKWTLLREIPSLIQLARGESRTITLRIRPSNESFGGIKYPINLQFEDLSSGFIQNEYFVAKTLESTNWNVGLNENVLFVHESEGLPDFNFKVKNSGNRIEAYDISFESQLRLTYPASGFQLILKPGQDTTITVGIRSRNLNQISDVVKIHIQARNMKKVLVQKIFIVSNSYKARPSKFQHMPIEASWRTANILNLANSLSLFNLEGYVGLEKGYALSFNYRSSPINNSYSVNNDLFQLNIHRNKSLLSLGVQQDFFQQQIDGYGAHFIKRNTQSNFEVVGLKNRINNAYQLGIRTDRQTGENTSLEVESLISRQQENLITTGYVSGEVKHRKSTNDFITLSSGYSLSQFQTVNETKHGIMAGAQFSTMRKWISLNSNARYFSPSFTSLNRGLQSHNHDVRFFIKSLFAGGFVRYSSRESLDFLASSQQFIQRFNNKYFEYGAQLGVRIKSGKLFTRLSQVEQLQFNINNPVIKSEKLSLNYNLLYGKHRHSVSVSYQNSAIISESTVENVSSLSSVMVGKYGNLGYQSRFDYGPNLYFDFLFYSQQNRFPLRHQHSIFFQHALKSKMTNRVSLNYFEMTQSNFRQFNLINDIDFNIPRAGLSLNLSMGLNLLRLKSTPVLNVAIRKNLNVPVPFYKKYRSLNVRLFKDENNNNILDEGEEPIENANLLINDKYLTTDSQGEINMINVERDKYIINYHTVQNQMGWVAKSILSDTIQLDKDQNLTIPFKKSKIVVGNIKVVKAPRSLSQMPTLGGIRVLATNNIGEVFRSITNDKGEFFFNLRSDEYFITMPFNLYGSLYQFTSHKLKVDLTEKEEEKVSFTLKEKVRKINIKRLED